MDRGTQHGSVPVPFASPPHFVHGFAPLKGDKDGTRMCKAREVQECSEAVGEVVCCMMRVWGWIIPSWPVCWSQQRPYGEAQPALSNCCFLHTPKHAVCLSIKELWTSHPLKWLTNVFDYVAEQIFRCWQSLVNQESRALSTEIHHVQGEISAPH